MQVYLFVLNQSYTTIAFIGFWKRSIKNIFLISGHIYSRKKLINYFSQHYYLYYNLSSSFNRNKKMQQNYIGNDKFKFNKPILSAPLTFKALQFRLQWKPQLMNAK